MGTHDKKNWTASIFLDIFAEKSGPEYPIFVGGSGALQKMSKTMQILDIDDFPNVFTLL